MLSTFNEVSREITNADNVLAIYIENRSHDPCIQLVFAGWIDGTVIWSNDRLNGGKPYRAAVIDSHQICDTLERLEVDGLFSKRSHQLGAVPGHEWTVLYARKDRKTFEETSCHEQFEQSGDCIMEQKRGVSPLGERSRFEALATQPQEYLFLRMLWLELRGRMESLIPDSGLPCAGEPEMLQGVVRWLPDTNDRRRTN